MPRPPPFDLRAALAIAILAHLAFVLVALARGTGWLERLELLAYDGALAWHAAASPPESRIVVVPITDADWRGWMGERFITDAALATVLERLRDAGATAIGLDLIRDRPEPGPEGDPADHDRLARILEETPGIIAVFGLEDADRPGFEPPPALAGRPERLGLADVSPDRDGVVRRGHLFLGADATLGYRLATLHLQRAGIVPAPAGETARVAGRTYTPLRLGATTYIALGPDDGGYAGAPAGGYPFLLAYPACAEPLPAIPIGRILDDPGAGEAVRDRIVLIGSRTTEAKDVFLAPLNCHGPAPRTIFGVDLHARIASQLIREALGEARPIRTLAQVLRDPLQGHFAEGAWLWLWTMLGAAGVATVPAGLALAALAVALLGALAAAGLGALVLAGWWLPVVPQGLGLLAAMALTLAYLLGRERRRWAILLDRFSAYVSRQVAERVLGRPGGPETEEVVATVLFSDIRGSTAIAEVLPEPELMAWLNEYMSVMADLVLAHGGSIEKFAGDGITAAFGLPEPRTDEAGIAADARSAVACALAMGQALERLNAGWAARGLPAIGIRIGIHTGPLMVGNLGSARRMQYSIIGDTANTAARLEAYAKDGERDPDHCRILISEATSSRLDGRYATEPVGPLSLKGKRAPILVHRVTGGPAPSADAEARGQHAQIVR